MRFFLRVLALFAIAIGLAVLARYNPGNVVLFYPPYRVDLSLNFFLLLAALLFLLIFWLMNALRMAQRLPARVAQYRRERREREANSALRESLRSLFEGRFGHAEKAAQRATELEENAGVAGLIGARAAHRMGQPERRDVWLSRVAAEPAMKTARLMTTIELMVDEERPEAALESVRELNASGVRHIHALRLALKANQRTNNWAEVMRLVRALDKTNAIHPALSRRLRELAYKDLLSRSNHDAESLARLWSTIPAADRVKPAVACDAAAAFNARGLHGEATAILEKAIAQDWDERLIRAYREGAAPQGSQALLAQIERCEQWTQSHPRDAELGLTLGMLCLRQKLWGKAQRHLEQALADASENGTVSEAHLRLASLFEALDQPELAAQHYRQCALASVL